jgi:hypothetical protein
LRARLFKRNRKKGGKSKKKAEGVQFERGRRECQAAVESCMPILQWAGLGFEVVFFTVFTRALVFFMCFCGLSHLNTLGLGEAHLVS